jgi:TrmH family RNA methyltransferase
MITSTANDRVKWVRALQSQRRQRQDDQRFVAEGSRWAQEFAKANLPPSDIFYCEPLSPGDRASLDALAAAGSELHAVSEAVMASMSDTESPQGILLVAPFPQPAQPAKPSLLVVVDRLGDPGNMGTLLRACLAAGVEGVILTTGTVDPFNPKVVRGGMGAQLYLPMSWTEPQDLPSTLNGLPLWLAETGQGPAYNLVDWREPCALMIGSEAHGAGPQARAQANHLTHIPMTGPADSLNAAVAAAVILFEIRRQRGLP